MLVCAREIEHMKYTCKYCGGIHDEGYECPKKPKRKLVPRPGNRKGTFRGTAEWTHVREQVLERDGYRCRLCEIEKTPRRYNRRLSVHHIVPLEEDWSRRTDIDNLITLCDMHHTRAENDEYDRSYLQRLAKVSPRA